MKRPLYLEGLRVKGIKLKLGALQISAHALADQFIPLTQLSRVVSKGNIRWDSEALMACMQQHIPISFLLNTGEPTGRCISHTSRASSHLQQRLEELASDKDIHTLLTDWKRHRRRALILKLARNITPYPQDLRAKAIRARLERQIAQEKHISWIAMISPLYPLIHSQIFKLLIDYGFSQDYLTQDGLHPDILNHIIDLLEWELWKSILLRQVNCPTHHGFKQRVIFFESQKHHLEKATLKHLSHLNRHLIQLDTPA